MTLCNKEPKQSKLDSIRFDTLNYIIALMMISTSANYLSNKNAIFLNPTFNFFSLY